MFRSTKICVPLSWDTLWAVKCNALSRTPLSRQSKAQPEKEGRKKGKKGLTKKGEENPILKLATQLLSINNQIDNPYAFLTLLTALILDKKYSYHGKYVIYSTIFLFQYSIYCSQFFPGNSTTLIYQTALSIENYIFICIYIVVVPLFFYVILYARFF